MTNDYRHIENIEPNLFVSISKCLFIKLSSQQLGDRHFKELNVTEITSNKGW